MGRGTVRARARNGGDLPLTSPEEGRPETLEHRPTDLSEPPIAASENLGGWQLEKGNW